MIRSKVPTLASLSAVLLLTTAAACSPRANVSPADLVLRNGKVVTMDSTTPAAQALAVTGDRITAVGSDADIEKYIGPDTRVIDL